MYKGQQIKFIEIDKITKSMFNAYISSIKEVSIDDFDELLNLYEKIYEGQSAKVVKSPYLSNENNNYYCDILINGEERKVFLEFIKRFTNMKNHVILEESLFTL